MEKCHPATFSHTNPLDIPEVWTATKLYILMLQTSNLAVLLIFACSFHFWYSQSARLVCRSPDQVLQSLLLFISTECTGKRVNCYAKFCGLRGTVAPSSSCSDTVKYVRNDFLQLLFWVNTAEVVVKCFCCEVQCVLLSGCRRNIPWPLR